MTTDANQVKAQIRDLIIQGTSIVPKTTLSANAVEGTLSASIVPLLNTAGNSRFVKGSRIDFFDALGEDTLTVSAVSADGTTLTFASSAGMGFTGLAATHPAGTTLYSNGMASMPTANATRMLTRGDPVLFVTVTEVTYPQPTAMPNVIFTPLKVHIQIDRPVDPPDSTYDSDMWAKFVEDQTNVDLAAIAETLLAHQPLATDLDTGVALELGSLHGGGPQIVTRAGMRPQKVGAWHWCGTVEVIVTAIGESYPAY